MIERILYQFAHFDTGNLKQLSDTVCVNYNERQERYTIYTLSYDNRITTKNIQVHELELIEMFWSVDR